MRKRIETSGALLTVAGVVLWLGMGSARIARADVIDTVPAGIYTINLPVAGDSINIVNGPVASGFQTMQVNSSNNTFTPIDFANKTAVTLNGLGGDTITLNNSLFATGLASLSILELHPAGTLIINANSTGPTINVLDGPVLGGNPTTQVNFGGGPEAFFIANTVAVTVNGSGSNNVTMNLPIISPGLTGVTVNGGNGVDSFSVTPSGVPFTVNGNNLSPPLPGNTLNVDLTGTTGAHLTKNSNATGFQGAWTFGNQSPVNFSNIQTFVPDPTVPEPGTLVLIGAGLAGVFILRRPRPWRS